MKMHVQCTIYEYLLLNKDTLLTVKEVIAYSFYK